MLAYLKPYLIEAKTKVLEYMLFIISSIILGFIEPYLNAKFVDNIVYQSTADNIKLSMAIVIVVNLLKITISYFSELYTSKVKTKLSFNMVSSMVEHIQRLPLLQVKKYDPAYLTTRISSDTNIVLAFFLDNFINVIFAPIIIVVSLSILVKTSLILAIISLICIPLYVLLYVVMKKPLVYAAAKCQ